MAVVTENTGRALDVGPEFHWQHGVYFARIIEPGHELDGGVRLRIEQGNGFMFEAVIDASSWGSIVAAVTPEGENATTYRIATGLHG